MDISSSIYFITWVLRGNIFQRNLTLGLKIAPKLGFIFWPSCMLHQNLFGKIGSHTKLSQSWPFFSVALWDSLNKGEIVLMPKMFCLLQRFSLSLEWGPQGLHSMWIIIIITFILCHARLVGSVSNTGPFKTTWVRCPNCKESFFNLEMRHHQ